MNDYVKKVVAAFKAFETEPAKKVHKCPDCGAEALVLWLHRREDDPELVFGKSVHCDNCGFFASPRMSTERVPLKE